MSCFCLALMTNTKSSSMTASTTQNSACVFPLFPRLAAELRNEVWRLALPSLIEPAVFYHKQKCMFPPEIAPDPANELHHEMFEPVYYQIPIAFVNHEARSVALAWARKHGLVLRACDDGGDPMFARRFDPGYDVMLYSAKECQKFVTDFLEGSAELFGLPRFKGPTRHCLERFALPSSYIKEVFVDDVDQMMPGAVSQLFNFLPRLRTLLDITNLPQGLPPPNKLPPGLSSTTRPYRWELIPQPGVVYKWNQHDERFEKSEDGSGTLKMSQPASNAVHQDTSSMLEIHHVLAVMVECRTGVRHYV
ncbi:hypothetical protein DM02DRAFT_670731 [Periconia macrospinosa]|uniref:2EXR domain-containing protein n=1 Tax=Periconia macrospinosa TaxID=97972 RepID=A0A2V1DXV3_9PLEO|nr:hypothetical protein DM02DRAFT_670731 [Periconia macrospinosa]